MAHKLSSFNKTEIDLFAHRTLSRPFDMLIDDGLHESLGNRANLAYWWRLVRPGGWYLIEDLPVAIVSPTTTFCPAESLRVSDFAFEEENRRD
ncbi:unnamed protein product [Amoebophrya sp. A25]|nr:unnamed protein product [Amoebophrya sp. A25]|eukprot:GSA25T00023348001.1